VSAQDLAWSFAGEAAGDKTYVLFAQPEVVFGSVPGWRPSIQLGGHVVWFDTPTGSDNSWGLTPAVGLRYQDSGGFFGGTVGWAIAGDENSFDPFGGGDNGLYTGLHAEYYGSGDWGLQGIADYNWGAQFLWSRAQILKRISQRSGGGGVSLGARLTWEADNDGDIPSDDRFQATMIGPVLQFSNAKGGNWTVSGGWKHSQPESTFIDNDTWYAQVDLYLP
jgi:hypothetical protein